MSQSLAKVLVHLIFSTKNRQPVIPGELREETNAYFVGILRNVDCPAALVNCMADHVHILCVLSKNVSLSKLIEEIKKGTSKWIKTKSPQCSQFHWQSGYGAFSVSESNVPRVRQYIADQEKHHRVVGFQDEFRAFLRRHGIAYDERYVWD